MKGWLCGSYGGIKKVPPYSTFVKCCNFDSDRKDFVLMLISHADRPFSPRVNCRNKCQKHTPSSLWRRVAPCRHGKKHSKGCVRGSQINFRIWVWRQWSNDGLIRYHSRKKYMEQHAMVSLLEYVRLAYLSMHNTLFRNVGSLRGSTEFRKS